MNVFVFNGHFVFGRCHRASTYIEHNKIISASFVHARLFNILNERGDFISQVVKYCLSCEYCRISSGETFNMKGRETKSLLKKYNQNNLREKKFPSP